MRVLLLHDAVAAAAAPEAQDTLVQAASVGRALDELGHACEVLPIRGDLGELCDRLARDAPEVVFNLVESLEGSDALAVAVPALLDGLGIPYTGSPTAAIALSNDKCAAKRLLARLHLPTAEWFEADSPATPFRPARYIVKARFEHASLGLEEDAIVELETGAAARRAVADSRARIGRPCFAERFIEGREFNLSLLQGPAGVEVLPAAEIDFSAFPTGKPRLVGYRAKWIEGSFEFHNTPRRFDFAPADTALLDHLRTLARSAFEAFGLRGYARIDFRVDDDGPFILELNANPCIAPDAGFAAALERAGLCYVDAVDRIVTAAVGTCRDDGRRPES